MADPRIEISTTDDISTIGEAAWDALLTDDDTPFVRYAWLRSLEEAGCVHPEAGWRPCHIVAREGGRVIGAVPAYLKGNSEGEFIFDFSWAQAASQFGVRYYPKLLVAVPFTPATGRRLLVRPGPGADELRGLLGRAVAVVAERLKLSGAHALFVRPEELGALGEAGLEARHSMQFHWVNQGYGSYDDFLSTFNSKRRHQLKRERREVEKSGVQTVTYRGDALTDEVLEAMFRFYVKGVEAHYPWGRQYLNRRFFELVRERMPGHIEVVLARDGGRPIAGCFNVSGAGRLYGRYWGCDEPRPFLHFHVCYYHSIEQCIERKLAAFEPGAGGEHKLPRGFVPTRMLSAHRLQNTRFHGAVSDFLARERAAIDAELQGPDED